MFYLLVSNLRFIIRGKWIVFLELRGLSLLVSTIVILVSILNFYKFCQSYRMYDPLTSFKLDSLQ